jgi:hypothetical protein
MTVEILFNIEGSDSRSFGGVGLLNTKFMVSNPSK